MLDQLCAEGLERPHEYSDSALFRKSPGEPDQIDRSKGFITLRAEIAAARGDPVAEEFLVAVLLWLNPCAATVARVPGWPSLASERAVGSMAKAKGKTHVHAMAASPIELYAEFIANLPAPR